MPALRLRARMRANAYWLCQALGWGAYAVVGMAIVAASGDWRAYTAPAYLFYFLYSIALTDLLRREIRRRDWLNGSVWGVVRKLAAAALAIGAIQTALILSVGLAFEGPHSGFLRLDFMLPVWLGTTYATGMWIFLYVRLTGRRRRRELETQTQLALREAELRALEAQINPHFLFNCLNSIRALVSENPALAQEMITRLANILRYTLHRDMGHTVPLASELEAVEDYLALESVRFEDRLRVEYSVDAATRQAHVPPMLLQTLVENAIKHGIGREPSGGELRIRTASVADATVIEVSNTGRLADEPARSTQLGLRNIRERLRILYGEAGSLQFENGNGLVTARVRIPEAR